MDPFGDLAFTETDRWRFFALLGPGHDHDPVPPAPWAALEARLEDPAGEVRLGLSDIAVAYAGRASEVGIETGGTTVARRRWPLAAGDRLACVVNGTRVTVLVLSPGSRSRRWSGRWRPVLSDREGVLARCDLTTETTWARQRWVVEGPVGDVRHGPFGAAGLRDPRLVVRADGSAYERDGRVFTTWSCAGLGGFAEAHWGVLSLEPDRPRSLRLEAHLWTRRDGRLLGDAAGQLVRDGGRWLVATSSWGDFDGTDETGVHVRTTTSGEDLLTGLHLLDTERVRLPHALAWDPTLLRDDAAGGRGWLVGYTAGQSVAPFRFRPALARTDGPDPWTGLRTAGVAEALDQAEGTVLVRRDGRTWLLASDAHGRRYPVFDTEQLAPAGSLRAPYPTNIPHPQLVPRADGSWLLLGFDGTPWEPRRRHSGRRPVLGYGTHGDVVVMTAPPTTGWMGP